MFWESQESLMLNAGVSAEPDAIDVIRRGIPWHDERAAGHNGDDSRRVHPFVDFGMGIAKGETTSSIVIRGRQV